jgi:demethylmenaquinone methyltransferase/2-methoxy-6-polyprenyl-1,4-benzoquinol methylase
MPDPDGIQERRLNDGRSFRIIKLFRGPAELASDLQALGWQTVVGRTASYFVFGRAEREQQRA